ncbi:MAG: cation transporter [Deltaproteobacteria bacterium]|nr:cation transporter [Deltaproteobacteria bacterium]
MTKQKADVALLSVISNATLVLLKTIIGVMIGSVSMISEAIHSGVDLLAASIALFAVKKSAKPADVRHPFGHGKVENISGTIEAILIFLAAGWIVFEAVKRLYHPEPLEAVSWGVVVMFLSAWANVFISQKLFKVSQETGSVALEADAWHLRTDVYTSIGVMVGLGTIWAGKRLVPGTNLEWVDPVTAIVVALLILKAAYELTIKSARDLLDASLPAEEEALIREHIKSFSPTVRSFHRFRTRKSGTDRFIEFHILVDSGMSVNDSHKVTDMMSDAIKEHYSDATVTIHIEPCDAVCTPWCENDCLLSDKDRRAIRTKHRDGSLQKQNNRRIGIGGN